MTVRDIKYWWDDLDVIEMIFLVSLGLVVFCLFMAIYTSIKHPCVEYGTTKVPTTTYIQSGNVLVPITTYDFPCVKRKE